MSICPNSSLTETLKHNTTSLHKPYEIGQEEEKLITELLNIVQEPHGYTKLTQLENTSTLIQKIQKLIVIPRIYSQEFCMLVYLAKNKKMTLKDRFSYFKRDSLQGKLYLILDLELITKDQDSPNWWNEFAEMKSKKLWLPSKIDSLDSDTTSLSKYATSTAFESWFSATQTVFPQKEIPKQKTKTIPENSKKTCSASSTYSLQGKMDDEQDNLEELEKGNKKKPPQPNSLKKIRMYPTREQKLKLHQVFDGNRWAYNTIVQHTEKEIFKSGIKVKDLKARVRPLVQKSTMIDIPYLKQVPEESLDSAFRDIWKARTAMFEASKVQKQKTGKGFFLNGLKFRKRKADSQSVEIRLRAIKFIEKEKERGITFWSKFFGKGNDVIQIKDKGSYSLQYSCRIQKTRTGQYYLCIPEHKEVKESTTTRTCAIDPGVRTMLTGFDPDGLVFEFGKEFDRIRNRYLLADRLKSRIRHFKGKRNERYNMKRQELSIYEKIKRMIKDCHHKASKWLSEKYHSVLLPIFSTSQMVKKCKRAIGKETVRKMLGWSHYAFKVLLRHKMAMNGNQLIDCTEEYTSKTCTSCGRINHLLGASKTFRCPYEDCQFRIDRDVGAARNIYVKNHKLIQ